MKNKITMIITFGLLICLLFTLCSCGDSGGSKLTGKIKVVAREEGSGTGQAFGEVTGVMENGNSNMLDTAEIAESNDAVIKKVSSETNAIGYVSVGSVDNDMKMLNVDGYEPNIDNINSGSYKLQRNLNFVTSGELSDAAQDFFDYVLSEDGQKIIESEDYAPINEVHNKYKEKKVSGKVVIEGSSSMTPVVEALAENYNKRNENVSIKIEKSNSSQGVQRVTEGSCDIGMASRDLGAEEMKAGTSSQVIAVDGIAVIVNKNNAVKNISLENLKSIYTGTIKKWSKIK
ncbi:MAG: phosphate ABC transporter substrate-binding protein [Clostridiales bacterium]|nr:phosphate ABC transporter substrate-binding protein [Clostridiales bacterium]